MRERIKDRHMDTGTERLRAGGGWSIATDKSSNLSSLLYNRGGVSQFWWEIPVREKAQTVNTHMEGATLSSLCTCSSA